MFVGLQFPSENEAKLLTKIYKIMYLFFQRIASLLYLYLHCHPRALF